MDFKLAEFKFDFKRFLLATVAGGFVYFLATSVFGLFTQMILPYDIFSIGGMRAVDDPLMFWFFFSGIFIVLGPALVYPLIQIKGKIIQKGIKFGTLMWLISVIPSAFIIFTTMNYPTGFYFDNIVIGLVTWMITGIILARIYKK